MSWLDKYLKIIQPTSVYLALLQEEHYEDEMLLKTLLEGVESVEKLTIRTESKMLHYTLAKGCPNTQRLVLESPVVSDALVEVMLEKMPKVNEISIIADALEFSGTGLVKQLQTPIQKLILKPYQLDY